MDIDAPAEAIRRAAAIAEQPTRDEAEFILLNPRRRAVYDRNHRVLSTIGQLRGRLALGMRPLWSHGDHQDFTQTFTPSGPDVWNAKEDQPEYPRIRRRIKWGWWIVILGVALILAACLAYLRGWIRFPRG